MLSCDATPGVVAIKDSAARILDLMLSKCTLEARSFDEIAECYLGQGDKLELLATGTVRIHGCVFVSNFGELGRMRMTLSTCTVQRCIGLMVHLVSWGRE